MFCHSCRNMIITLIFPFLTTANLCKNLDLHTPLTPTHPPLSTPAWLTSRWHASPGNDDEILATSSPRPTVCPLRCDNRLGARALWALSSSSFPWQRQWIQARYYIPDGTCVPPTFKGL
ncbi:hypothetical protein B0T13DRAFT_482739 [Neurospora crassa]|nr:hypothetical protein B0T13DRAFT_482739 [Neurospora crassa]